MSSRHEYALFLSAVLAYDEAHPQRSGEGDAPALDPRRERGERPALDLAHGVRSRPPLELDLEILDHRPPAPALRGDLDRVFDFDRLELVGLSRSSLRHEASMS